MKKDSPGSRPGATLITPSAPMPVWRSQSAATSSADSWCRSSRSSTITKSLPVPWYFQIVFGSVMARSVASCIPMKVPGHGVREPGCLVREPADPWIPAEPGELAARERLRALHGSGDRFVQAQLTFQVPRELSVADGLARGEPPGEPAVHELLDLLDQARRELLTH